jgi:carboxymethylenebutenolidase
MLKSVKVDVSGSSMSIELATPETDGPFPGLILCHHREGVDEFTLDAAKRLAASGYVVAVPNMYHRRLAEEGWQVSRKYLHDLEIVADIRATAGLLMRQPSVRPDAIGIIGHCMGGRTAFLGAAILPLFKVAVMLYGGHIFKTEGQGMPPPIEFTKDIRAVMLGLYGKDDHVIGVEEVKRLDGELRRHNVKHEFHIYDNAGHAFQDFSRPDMYRKDASDDAWKRVITFLHKSFQ